ncbi:lytic transglycosylase domain-containing protein [Thermodesulfobacteriota bacterium]
MTLIFTSPSNADNTILIKNIIEYNRNALEKSLADGTYKGEAGILRVGPKAAISLGLKVVLDKEYLDAKKLLKKAESSFKKVKSAMYATEKEPSAGYYVQEITSNYILYKKSSEEARKKYLAYHSALDPEADERLNRALCLKVMNDLLLKSIKKADNRMRDALGTFYNISQGVNGKKYPLTSENVRFVNFVFNRFVEQASQESYAAFDMDQDSFYKGSRTSSIWKEAVGKDIINLVPLLEEALKKAEGKIYDIDPLLFIALMRKESSFNPLAISYVGAAGLTQIMPKTALALGMDNIYSPEYFDKAVELLREERKIRYMAMDALEQVIDEESIETANEARRLMQASITLGKTREALFNRYKKELLKEQTDDRLKAEKSIEFGLKYFAGLLKDQKGDMSLALASYNAGPHRIKEYRGIPPFDETVGFRNRVLKFYRDYVSKINN